MAGLIEIAKSNLTSGGIVGHGSLEKYLADAAAQVLRLGAAAVVGGRTWDANYVTDKERIASGQALAGKRDGSVDYLAKPQDGFIKRALVQATSQAAYGFLRSYPRYLLYYEQKMRDEHIKTNSDSALANENGKYSQLIREQMPVRPEKRHTDTIVGRAVADYLELAVPESGQYYNHKTGQLEDIATYGAAEFVDLGPQVQVSSRNNVVLTSVQGRDFTRKELVSGGDYEITVNGMITSKYPDIYPESEVSKFLKLMQFRGVLRCDNTILRQFGITNLVVLSYSLCTTQCRNVQPYTLTCVAVEPPESVSVKTGIEETVDAAVKHTNKWLKWARLGAQTVDPSSLLKFSPWV